MPNRQEIGSIDDPSFVWFEDSGETYLELQDSDGNVIIRFNQDESISNVGSLSLGSLSITEPRVDGTFNFDSSETRDLSFGGEFGAGDLGSRFLVLPSPDVDPDADFGVSYDANYWDDSAENIVFRFTETEGGGLTSEDVRITIWVVGV